MRSIRAYARDQSSVYSDNDALCHLLEPALASVSGARAPPPGPVPWWLPRPSSEVQPSAPPLSTPSTPFGTVKVSASDGATTNGQASSKPLPPPPPPKCGIAREQLFSIPAPAPPPRPPRSYGGGPGTAPLSASLRVPSEQQHANQQPLRIPSGNAPTATGAAQLDPEYAQIPELPLDSSSTRSSKSIAIPPRVFEVCRNELITLLLLVRHIAIISRLEHSCIPHSYRYRI